MYFCIFGFQRLVWWPKCTPASSNSFMVSAAMAPPSPSVCLRRTHGRGPHRVLPGVRDGTLCRVLRVDPHVLLAEVAGPDPLLAASKPQIDRDRVLRLAHRLADPIEAGAFSQGTALDQRLVVEENRHPVLVHLRRGLAERHHDAPPVRVLAVDGRLHERRVRDATRGEER